MSIENNAYFQGRDNAKQLTDLVADLLKQADYAVSDISVSQPYEKIKKLFGDSKIGKTTAYYVIDFSNNSKQRDFILQQLPDTLKANDADGYESATDKVSPALYKSGILIPERMIQQVIDALSPSLSAAMEMTVR